MREITLAFSILSQLLSRLEKMPYACEVGSAHLIIGALHNYDNEKVVQYFNTMKICIEGLSICRLKIDQIEPRAVCQQCKRRSKPTNSWNRTCHFCASNTLELLTGKEFDFVEIVMLAEPGNCCPPAFDGALMQF